MFRKPIISGFIGIAALFLLFFAVSSFACGGEGPCPGTADAGHGHAYLVITNVTSGTQVPIPGNIGLRPVTNAEGKESFCYEAIHTHGEDATLHFQIGEGNERMLGAFLTKWGRTDLLMNARVTADGEPVKNPMELQLEPEMKIEIFFHGPPKAG